MKHLQTRRARGGMGYLVAAAMSAAAGCGSAADPFTPAPAPANPNTSTCYRCSVTNPNVAGSGITQTTYACSAADAQQFGRPCLR